MPHLEFNVDNDNPTLSAEHCTDCKNGMAAIQKALGILERCKRIGADVEVPIAECKRVYGLLQGYLQEFGPKE